MPISTPKDDYVNGESRVARVVRIEGRVQGVGFRYWIEKRAQSLGLDGYVRNLTDGAVEALFIGAEPELARMLIWLEDGPSGARIDHLKIQRPVTPDWLEWRGFRRLRTAPPDAPA